MEQTLLSKQKPSAKRCREPFRRGTRRLPDRRRPVMPWGGRTEITPIPARREAPSGCCLPHGQVHRQDPSDRGDPQGRGGRGHRRSRELLVCQVRPKRREKQKPMERAAGGDASAAPRPATALFEALHRGDAGGSWYLWGPPNQDLGPWGVLEGAGCSPSGLQRLRRGFKAPKRGRLRLMPPLPGRREGVAAVGGGEDSPMAPAARGSLSHRVGRGDRRCPAAPPALGDRGDHQDPAGRQRREVRAGREPAQREVTPPPPPKKISVPQGHPRQVRLSRRGGRRGLGARGHQHGLGDRHRHEHPWDRLCQRSRGGQGGLGYPARGEGGVSANRGGSSTFPPASRPRAGAPGGLLRCDTLRKAPFYGVTGRLLSSGTPPPPGPGTEQAASPRAPESGWGEESQLPPSQSQSLPAAPRLSR